MPYTNHRQAGMATPLVITVLLVVAALAGATLYGVRSAKLTTPSPSPMVTVTPTVTEATASGPFEPGGEVLAGTVSPLIDFNRADYDRALDENRTVLLYFFANWCPICRVEFRDVEAAFRELNEPNVVGFRVNYSDDGTDDDEESLARQFGIAYQHTKVIIRDGTPVLKDGSTWDRDRYVEELTKVTGE